MKILMINEKYSYSGGSEQYLFNVCEGLEERGHEVSVIYGEGVQVEKAEREIFLIPNLNVVNVKRVVDKIKPDVVNLQNVFNNDLYKILPSLVPTVRYIHDHRTYSPGSSSMHFNSNSICEAPLSWFHQPIYAYREKCMSRNPLKILNLISQRKELLKLQSNLKKVIANSSYVKKRLVSNGVKESLIEVLPPFVSPSVSQVKNIPPLKPIILYAGRLFIEKGVDYVILIMKEIEAEFWILGEGWDETRLKKLTKDLSLEDKVKFFGFVKEENLADFYEKATCVVVPSIWPEPFGLSGTLAMSFGKPVVGFDVGGVKDWLLDGEVGFLVKRGDKSSLKEKLNLLLKDKDLRERLGKRGLDVAKTKFSKDKHIDRLIEIYKEVM